MFIIYKQKSIINTNNGFISHNFSPTQQFSSFSPLYKKTTTFFKKKKEKNPTRPKTPLQNITILETKRKKTKRQKQTPHLFISLKNINKTDLYYLLMSVFAKSATRSCSRFTLWMQIWWEKMQMLEIEW